MAFRLQFTQANQNLTKEDCKYIAWSDESQFLLQHSDGRGRILYKSHGSILPCNNGSGWFKRLSIVADRPSFMTTVS